MNLLEIEKEASKDCYKVVSFDLYDTVLFRPFFSDEERYDFLSSMVNNEFAKFPEKRHRAQRQAIQDEGVGKEVSLDKIYKQFKILTGETKISHVQNSEVALEKLSYSFDAIRDLIKRLKRKGKLVICISDMYLSKPLIESILEKEKLDFDKVFVSSETGATKSSGLLFQEVFNHLQNENIINDQSQVLHIGDNPVSDYQRAKENGFSALSTEEEVKKQHLSANYQELQKLTDGLNSKEKLLLALVAKSEFSTYSPSTDLCEKAADLGYSYGGPLIVNVGNWLFCKAKAAGKKKIILLRRDGYTLLQYFNALQDRGFLGEVEVKYLPISRVFTYAINYRSESDIYETLGEHPIKAGTTIDNLMSTRFNFVDKTRVDELLKNKKLNRSDKIKDVGLNVLTNFLKENAAEFFLLACQQKEKLEEYYKKEIGDADKCIFFDLGYTGSSQKALERLLNKPLDFAYFRTHQNIWKRLGNQSQFDSFIDTYYVGSGDNLSPIFEPFFLECAPSLLLLKKDENGFSFEYEREIGWGIRGVLAVTAINSGVKKYIDQYVKLQNEVNLNYFYSKELTKRLIDRLFLKRNQFKTVYSMIAYENSITGENLFLDNNRYWERNYSFTSNSFIANSSPTKVNEICTTPTVKPKINVKQLRILAEKHFAEKDEVAALRCLYAAAEIRPDNKNIRKRIVYIGANNYIRSLLDIFGYSKKFEG